MAGYIGSKSSVTLVDGYTEAEADAEFVTKTGDSMTGNLSLGDNNKAIFGAGSDLEIYHDGTNNRLTLNSANTYIQTDGIVHFTDIGNNEKHLTINDDGAVQLYHNNNLKLATTSAGVNIGTIGSNPVDTDADDLIVANASGASGIQISSASNSAGKFIFGDADNARSGMIYYSHISNFMRFDTAGLERMRIDSSGKVGIGDTSPSARLEIGGMAAGEQALLIQSGRNDALSNGLARINITDSNCPFAGLQINHAGTGPALVAIGKVAIGDTNPTRHGITTKALIYNGSTTTGDFALHVGRLTGGAENVVCISNGNGKVGSITTSGSSTAYNTSSDYRLKENIVDLTGASARVNQLDVKRFNWIADDTNTAVDGFLAHEVATVVPEAINGTKDAMRDEEYEVTPAVLDDDGNVTTEAVIGTRSVPDYQGIDQSKLVPLLTAALQEALTEIASLKTRVEALEA